MSTDYHGILVMLKREMDDHVSDPTKYELPKTAWAEAVEIFNKMPSPAVALGSIRSAKKAKSSRANGKLGGRPKGS